MQNSKLPRKLIFVGIGPSLLLLHAHHSDTGAENPCLHWDLLYHLKHDLHWDKEDTIVKYPGYDISLLENSK